MQQGADLHTTDHESRSTEPRCREKRRLLGLAYPKSACDKCGSVIRSGWRCAEEPSIQKEAAERIEKLDAAYKDAISALRYIRLHYGDLYGVGWARLDETYMEVCNNELSMTETTETYVAEIEYRKLLIAYMTHIIGREGTSQIEFSCPFPTGLEALSKSEMDTLEEIEKEADELLVKLDDAKRGSRK